MNAIILDSNASSAGCKRMRSEDFYDTFQSTILPQDVLKLIFAELNFKKLVSISLVCREWNQLANDPLLQKEIAWKLGFTPLHWNKFCGEGTVVDEEIEKAYQLLPNDIGEILKKPCPAFEGKRLLETHLLIWIPENICGEALSHSSFKKLLEQNPEFPKYCEGFVYEEDFIVQPSISRLVKSRFVLISNNILPNSQKKDYTFQKKIVKSFNINNESGWRVPKLIETLVCIFAEYLRSGTRLYLNRSTPFIRCQEKHPATPYIGKGQYIVNLGESGFFVNTRADSCYTAILSLKEL